MQLRDPHQIEVQFVNEVANVGFLNGVINVTLVTAQFTPDGDQIPADMVVASRLRFDLMCAQQLHQMLGQIIEANTKPASTVN